MSNLVLYSIPIFLLSMALELAWTRRHPDARGYELRDTAASLSMGLGSVLLTSLTKVALLPSWAWLHQHRVADLPATLGPWAWPLLFIMEDHCYYWFHRLHHEVRVLWSGHVVHHSSRRYNLSTALRQPWLTAITGPVFWLPLPLLGFTPLMILTAQGVSLLYQFWLHTEAVPKLGVVEAVFNTPSHHRVHHGKNPRYLDKNHGGILIIWDRLFGTFEPEGEPVTYGITKDIDTYNPVLIATHDLVDLAHDVANAGSPRRVVKAIIGRPGSLQSERAS